jgi:MFS family permease
VPSVRPAAHDVIARQRANNGRCDRERAVSSPATLFAVAAICFLFGFTGRGLIESFVVFLLPLSSELGLDRAATASIYALSVLMAGIGGPVVGRLFDRAGPRIVYSVGLTLLGGGLSLAAFATELWHLQLSLGLAVGLGRDDRILPNRSASGKSRWRVG